MNKPPPPGVIDAEFVEEDAYGSTGVQTNPQRLIAGAELNRLCQQLVDLREALKPFAGFADLIKPEVPDITTAFMFVREQGSYFVTAGQIRHAAALLKQLEEEDTTRHILIAESAMATTEETCAYCGNVFTSTTISKMNALGDGRTFCSERCNTASCLAEIKETP